MPGITAHSSLCLSAHIGQYLTCRNLFRQVCRTEAGLTRVAGLGQGIQQSPITLGETIIYTQEGRIYCDLFDVSWSQTPMAGDIFGTDGCAATLMTLANSTAGNLKRKGAFRMQKSMEVDRVRQRETCFYRKPCS